MSRRKRSVSPKPAGCRVCKGQPWVQGEGGMARCACPAGVWYAQQERARRLADPYREINSLFDAASERGGR